MSIKKLFIISLCLTVLCILVIVGASIIKHLIPSIIAIYTTMFWVGVTGTVLYGLYSAYLMAVIIVECR